MFMGGGPFEVHRGVITQSAVEPFWVIEGFDVIEDGQARVMMSVKVLEMEAFGFERAPERFHGGVVVTVSRRTHAGAQVTGMQQRPEGAAGILQSAI